MAYVNKYDKDGSCSAIGHNAENTFVKIAQNKGFEVNKATKRKNMFSHIDFHLSQEGKENMDVDVKARKKTSRKDNKFNDDWIWLEFKNVQGKKGWLLGDSTHIVFEREKEFAIVPREALASWAKQAMAEKNGGKITITCKAKNAKDARYKYYTRWNRDDLLTQVNYQDMVSAICGIKIWVKQ